MLFKKNIKYILHIGTNKTGTTAIQSFLYNNREELKEFGFYYPDFGLHNHGHHNLARLLKGAKPDLLNIQSNWQKQLKSHLKKYEKTIISSELFHTFEHPKILHKFFPRNETLVILYIREHLVYLMSWYQQAVQLRNITCSFKEYVDFHYCQLDYSNLISKWKDAYGSANVKIEVFDRTNFINNNIIEDFSEKAGISFKSTKPTKKESNKSIAGNLLFFKLFINNFIEDDNNYRLAYEIARLSDLDPSFSGKITIDPEVGNVIRSKYNSQRYKLKFKYGLNFNISNLENSNKNFYDIDNIDRDFKRILSFSKKNKFKIYEKIPQFILEKF